MRIRIAFALIGAAVLSLASQANAEEKKVGHRDTPMLPGGKWHVHDSERPQPTAVTPGTFSTQETPGKPPSDAVVLFDGTDTSKFQSMKGGPAPWKVENGVMVASGGDIRTKEEFGDCQFHIEWTTPDPPFGDIMNRGNSGVYFFGRYEVQIFESYKAGIYADGQAAAIYGQFPPLVNASRKPGEWQTYDIILTAPRFKDGKLEKPACMTVLHNGVVVHNHTELLGATGHRILPKYTPHEAKGFILLQDHGNPVRFRNIWVRPVKDYDEP
ncbi:MAG: DUF1080 domain-containing protein [Planctomycetota bacterium]|nr:DUF1080 domain-containing protein [Planctomycetota bacterium]